MVTGRGYGAGETLNLTFIEASIGLNLGTDDRRDRSVHRSSHGPGLGDPRKQKVKAKGGSSGQSAKATFTVT